MAAYAALDLGTTRLKLACFEASSVPVLEAVGSLPTQVHYGTGGDVRCRFSEHWEAVEKLLQQLGEWSRVHRVNELHIGLCSQVSSLLLWDARAGGPVEDSFPIWMDTTCQESIKEFEEFCRGGKDLECLGTYLPAATNWLCIKLLHHTRKNGALNADRVLQIGDAIFLKLTGQCLSHPSSQISMVDHRNGLYAPEIARFAGVRENCLPELSPHGRAPLLPHTASELGLPEKTFLYTSMMDGTAAMLGLFLSDGDGLLLASTSEHIGQFNRQKCKQPPLALLTNKLGDGWITYGSTSSGGHTVQWLMKSVLGTSSPQALAQLSAEAEKVAAASEGLFFLPYLTGERAPLWDKMLSGVFAGLRAHHGPAHLLRAVLEGVAFSRRQAAGFLCEPRPARFRIGGGGSTNPLWNKIRAAVLGAPLLVTQNPDLSLIGAIRHSMEVSGSTQGELLPQLLNPTVVQPDSAQVAVYQKAYEQFVALQAMLNPFFHPESDVKED